MGKNKSGLPEKVIHGLFEIGIWWKGLDGILEIIGGFFLFFVTPQKIGQLLFLLTQRELAEDPKDLVAGYLARFSGGISHHDQLVGAAYLWVHGVVKVGLVVGLLTGKKSAYPWAMGFLAVFFLYQLYQFYRLGSIGLLAMSIIDVLVLLLVALEYRRIRRNAV